jgi:pyruvate dehydrogenase E1 component alpha subunit
MGTTVERSSAEPELYKRAAAYRMVGERVDGTDVLAVRDTALRLVEAARTQGKPALLEAVSHRLRGHSVVDPAKYRSETDVAAAQDADPLTLFKATLLQVGACDEDGAAALERSAQDEADAAVAYADASPHPDPSTLFDYTYATPVPGQSRRLPADPLF